MIKSTFDLFSVPFKGYIVDGKATNNANTARDYSIEIDSWSASLESRVLYVAQIVASIASVPFLLIAGCCDLLKGEGNLLQLPATISIQLFCLLPLSILGAILPMRWNKAVDDYFSQSSQERHVNNLLNDSFCFLEMLQETLDLSSSLPIGGYSPGQAEFAQAFDSIIVANCDPVLRADVELATRRKRESLRKMAKTHDLTQLKQQMKEAPENSSKRADLVKAIKNKESELNGRVKLARTLDAFRADFSAAVPDSVAQKDLAEIILRKRCLAADGTIPELTALRNGLEEGSPERLELSEVIQRKYAAANTLQDLNQLREEAQDPLVQADLDGAIAIKQERLHFLSVTVKLQGLKDAAGIPVENRIERTDYTDAAKVKSTHLDELVAAHTLTELQDRLSKTRTLLGRSDLSETIVRKYIASASLLSLSAAKTKNAKNPFLQQAFERENARIDREVNDNGIEELQRQLEEAADAVAKANCIEALARKFELTKTRDALLDAHTAAPEDSEEKKILQIALRRKNAKIDRLSNSRTHAALDTENKGQKRKIEEGVEDADPIAQDIIQEALARKTAEIDKLCNHSWEHLIALRKSTKEGIPRKNIDAAIEKKEEWFKEQLQDVANTLEHLQIRIAAVEKNSEPWKDLAEAIRRQYEATYTINELREQKEQGNKDPLLPQAIQRKEAALARMLKEVTLDQMKHERDLEPDDSVQRKDLDLAIEAKEKGIEDLARHHSLDTLINRFKATSALVLKDDFRKAIEKKKQTTAIIAAASQEEPAQPV